MGAMMLILWLLFKFCPELLLAIVAFPVLALLLAYGESRLFPAARRPVNRHSEGLEIGRLRRQEFAAEQDRRRRDLVRGRYVR